MAKQRRKATEPPLPRWYRGKDIPMRVIRRFAREVAEMFRPEKIILFGSYAYGTPHEDRDVDILVVMPARNTIDQGVKIRLTVDAPFPMDLIVRTPKELAWRLEAGDWFLREIVGQGMCFMNKLTREWVRKAEEDRLSRLETGAQTNPTWKTRDVRRGCWLSRVPYRGASFRR